jgi:subtilisin family serine protease
MFAEALAEPSALLDDEGFVPAPDPSALPSDPALGGYVSLPQTSSLIIEPAAGTTASEVSDLVGDEYIVMEDIELTVPDPAGEAAVPADAVLPIDQVVPGDTQVAAAHEKGNRGKGAVVAIVDSGCAVGHDQFSGHDIAFGEAPEDGSGVQTKPGFDSATHGTHVSGIVSGGTLGVAPDADLIVVSVLSPTLKATASRVWYALSWLLDRIGEPPYDGRPVVLNMSLGFKLHDIEVKSLQPTIQATRELLRTFMYDEAVLPVIAIGNEGPGTVRAPGYFPEALAVGGVGYDLSEYTNSGGGPGPAGFELEVNPDIAGFGVQVLSSLMVDDAGKSLYGMKTGTSMAAPYVAGVAALVAAKTGLEGTALRDRLVEAALPVPLPADRVGAGLARYPTDLL